jgi:hypothetical protein
MEATDIRILGDLQRLALGPDDAVVLTVERPLTRDQFDRIKHQVNAEFPGRKIVVLDCNVRLATMGPDDKLDRILSMLTTLVQGLAEDAEEAQPQRTLDGEYAGGEREEGRSL